MADLEARAPQRQGGGGALELVFHKLPAALLNDYDHNEEKKILDTPSGRPFMRVALIAVVGAALVMGTMVLAMRQPPTQIVREENGQKFASKHFLGQYNSSGGGVRSFFRGEGHKVSEITCPCANPYVSWVNYTTFSVVYEQSSNVVAWKPMEYTADVEKGICNISNPADPTQNNLKVLCESVVNPFLSVNDSRTVLELANVVSPLMLASLVGRRMTTTADTLGPSFGPFAFIDNDGLYIPTMLKLELFRRMAYQFTSNASSSISDYWLSRAPGFSMGIAVDMEWGRYLQACKPSFCDVVNRVGMFHRALAAIAQVGGISNILTLALTYALWPVMRKLCLPPHKK